MRCAKHYIFFALLCVSACQKYDFGEPAAYTDQSAIQEQTFDETLVLTNDTMRIFVSNCYHENIILSDGQASVLKDYVYESLSTPVKVWHIPSRSEALLLHAVHVPDSLPHSAQRMLCYDSATETYYTYTYNNAGSVTRAGYKTKYALQPIRTEHIDKDTLCTPYGVTITLDDVWQ